MAFFYLVNADMQSDIQPRVIVLKGYRALKAKPHHQIWDFNQQPLAHGPKVLAY